MAIDYDKLRVSVAERLIRENGKPGTIIRSAPDPSPEVPIWELDSIPDDEYPVLLVETDWAQNLRSTETVEKWDVIGIISTETGVTPLQTDRLEIGGTEYHITEVRPLAPGPVTMLFYFKGSK